MRRLAWLSVGLVAACKPTSSPPPAEPPPLTEFRPLSTPAERYGDPPPTPAPSPAVEAIRGALAQIARERDQPAPQLDPRLSAMAADLAAGTRPGALPSAAVELARSHRGIVEPSPAVLSLAFQGHTPEALGLAAQPSLEGALGEAGFNRVGVAAVERGDSTAVVVVLQDSYLTLDPVPRRLDGRGRATLQGRLVAPYRSPQVYVTDATGAVSRPAMEPSAADAFRAEVRCGDVDGVHQVEVLGEGPRGPSVLARFPVWCGVAPPSAVPLSATTTPEPVLSPAEAEEAIRTLVNADRARIGLAPLAAHAEAAAVARAHSEEMRDRGYVGHVSPTSGGIADRARRARLPRRLVLENVARAESPAEIHQGLMDSPAHRINILHPEVTHVGIGVAAAQTADGRPDLHVTQVFLRAPAPLDAASARAEARAELLKARRLEVDPELDRLAQAGAEDLAAGRLLTVALKSWSERALEQLAGRFRQVGTVLSITESPARSSLARTDVGDATHYGLGLAVGEDAEAGGESAYIIVLLGRKS